MTATSYTTLDSDDLGANKILRAATMSALDSNPVAIAQRGTDAPWLNGVGAITALTSGSGNWTVPAGVYRIKVIAVGGGGGGSGGGGVGGAGGTTTFSTMTANGGSGSSSGNGGSATGGDINIAGTSGFFSTAGVGGNSILANIGRGGFGAQVTTNPGGGGGGTCIKVFSVEPGDTLSYSVGVGGSAGNAGGGNAGQAGSSGIIIIEY